jgi:hypothetical protein
MMIMIVEDVAAAAAIGLFFWLVPMRRNGIPGLRGRGRAPRNPAPMNMQPRPVPVEETIGATGDTRVVAELDQTRTVRHAGQVAAHTRGHKNSA